MRTKPKPRTAEVADLAGTPHAELAARCPEHRPNLPTSPCTNQSCPWRVDGVVYLNCAFVAFEAVAATGQKLALEEIGEMMGVTREGVRQIEKRGLKRLGRRMKALRII